MPKIKNIIIFISITAVFILIYVFFIQKPATPDANLVTSYPSASLPDLGAVNTTNAGEGTQNIVAQEFLTLLLSVKNIKLDDSIFADVAWSNLQDSSIMLMPDGTEGRTNPFAPIGSDKTDTVIQPQPVSSPAPQPVLNPTGTPR